MARAFAAFKKQPVLCLPPATGDLPTDGGVIVCSPATPHRKQIEHAGHVYQEKLIRTYAINQPREEEEKGGKDPPEPQPGRIDLSAAAKKLASKLAVGSDDLYELLELGDKRWHATADDIKKSFRRISLIYHPDKISHQGDEARKNSETHFKAVMKAYDVLSDKKKRAAYDSIDDVDDSIPSEKDAMGPPQRFYDKFGSCFALNARWSTSNRVPDLGDDDTSMEAVHKFYDFWYSFKSWRDFSFGLEYDTDQAECREEKRWMDRQNSKHVKAKKLEENARIRGLVDLAYKHDPRLVRERQAAKAKKDAVKEERRRKAEEVARVAKEKVEREQREAEQQAADEKVRRAAAKKQKDAARQVLRKARQRLRAIGRELELMNCERGLLAVEEMCAEGTLESIEAVTKELSELQKNEEKTRDTAIDILGRTLGRPTESVARPSSEEVSPRPETPNVANGVEERGSQLRDEKSEESKQSISVPNGHAKDNRPTEPIWTPEELSLLSKGVAKFPGGTRDRWNRLAQYMGTKTADEILRKVNESRPSRIKPGVVRNASKEPNGTSASERSKEKKKGKPVVPPGSAGSATQSAPVTQPPNKLQFTKKQQQLFEAALKKHSSALGESRWRKVSEAVGRTPEQCKERFAELIAFYKPAKSAKKPSS